MQEINLIREFPGYDIKQNQALSTYTNTRVGGPADWIFWPRNLDELSEVTRYARNQALPITVLGNASNLIITNQGLRGLVIFLTRLTEISVNESTVTAAAGAAIIDTAQVACEHNLAGLEWAAGIPGSVGGAVYMNAGAYGGQVDDCLLEAVVLTPEGVLKTYSKQALDFGYRHSAVQGTGEIIVSATFQLIPDAKVNIAERMEDFNDRRASKQPLEYPSCGSVFKRPEGYFAGKLIMDAGLQGFQVGGAQVSTKHAGFIVNKGQATGSDYVAVIQHVQAVVHEQFQVDLEPEVRILGE